MAGFERRTTVVLAGGIQILVARQMHADRGVGTEALGPSHAGDVGVGADVPRSLRPRAYEAESDEGVGEEDGDGEDDEDEENVDFLAETGVCESQGEIWMEISGEIFYESCQELECTDGEDNGQQHAGDHDDMP
jgi:hypothetical protein